MSRIVTDSPADPPFPRLGISDLLVLTLTTAFGMAWIGALGKGDPPPDTTQWASKVGAVALDAFNGTLIGVELFGFAVLVREISRRHRPLRSLSPGHWWFLITGPQYLLGLFQYVIATWGSSQFVDIARWRTIEGGVSALIYLLFVMAWLWVAAKMKTGLWRAVFVIKALEQFVWLAFRAYRALRDAELWTTSIHAMHFFGVMGTLFACLLAALLIAVAYDIRRKVKRDWLHYVGVAVIVAESFNFFEGFGRLVVRWWSALWLHLFP
jgi:hypothetical protein